MPCGIATLPLRRWLELADGPGRMRPMEGLRGVAVILVFLQHYAVQTQLFVDLGPVSAELAAMARSFGNLGVELFFILSGYLIYGTLLRRNPGFLPFMARRVERLYPAFLAVFALAVAWHLLLRTGEIPAAPEAAVRVILANLLFLPGVVAMPPVLEVAWTLSWEMAFYLLLGLAVPGLRMAAWPRAGRIAFIIAGAAAVTAGSLAAPQGIGPFAAPLVALPFFAGMLLFEVKDTSRLTVPGGLAFAAGAGALLFARYVAPSRVALEWMETLALTVLCAAAFQDGNSAARLLAWEKLRWLGNMSYSYYLLHGVIVVATFRGLAWQVGLGWPSWAAWGLLPVTFALSVAASLGLFLAVERPFSLKPRRICPAAAPTAASRAPPA